MVGSGQSPGTVCPGAECEARQGTHSTQSVECEGQPSGGQTGGACGAGLWQASDWRPPGGVTELREPQSRPRESTGQQHEYLQRSS